jgi:hypothetical protein
MLDLDKLKELCEKATPEPWSRSWIAGAIRHINRNVDFDAFWFPTDEEKKNLDRVNYPSRHEPDYDFIVTSRTALPALISAYEKAREALKAARVTFGVMEKFFLSHSDVVRTIRQIDDALSTLIKEEK